MKQIRKVNKEGMRQNNIHLIFETIYRNEGITRAQLAAKTHMSAMAVGRIVDFLLRNKLIFDQSVENTNDIGRPAARVSLNRGIVNVGVSLDPEGVYIGQIDPYGELLHLREHRFSPKGMEPEAVLKTIAEHLTSFLAAHSIEKTQAIGMVAPGIIDFQHGIVRFSSQLNWTDVPVVDILEKFPRMPKVIIDNDIKARAQAESRLGAGRAYPRSVLLNIGSGVGAGVIIENEIYRGKENLAGEIGHTALGINNRMCECGRKGCLEATISQPALLREARSVDPGIDIAGLEAAYTAGAPWARTLLDMSAEHILMVIDLLANAYAPDMIILCGRLMDRCAVLRNIIMGLHNVSYPKMLNNQFNLAFSEFGPNGNVIGAAVIAFNHNVSQFVENSSSL